MVLFYKIRYFFSGFLLLLIFSCQSETSILTVSNKEIITKASPLASYVQRIVMQNTSDNNVVDNSDCFTVQFPYRISLNNKQITLNSEADYSLVENAKKAFSNDNDIVYFNFPITIVFNNYTKKVVNNQTELNNLYTECAIKASDFTKINCLKINYPIVINSYNSNNQIANSTTIIDNKTLFDFLDNQTLSQFIAINYPITITDFNGKTITISSNNQLENSIRDALTNCPLNNSIAIDFVQNLTTGSWIISFFYDDTEKTYLYSGYVFTFKNDTTLIAIKSGISKNGTWSVKTEKGIQNFTIKFENDLLSELDEKWEVFECTTSQLRLRDPTEDAVEIDYLYFQKK